MRRILIDDVDKTKEIESIKLSNNKYLIKFKNSEKYYTYSSERIKIENNNFDNNLKYFKELAEKISIVVGDYNVLGSRYKNLDNLNKDSVLNYYLKGTLPLTYRMVRHARFPFGFNQSQKKATEEALTNRISVIEGPPGTGKTQTILNIISNLVMNNETVAVVSNNNSAIQNVYDKLKNNNLDFIVAFLGKDSNKTKFIENQESLPNLDAWLLTDEEAANKINFLNNKEYELNRKLEDQNKLAKDIQCLDALRLESNQFLKYYKTRTKNINISWWHKPNYNNILKLWIDLENKENISLFAKIKYFIKYGLFSFKVFNNNLNDVILELKKLYYENRIDNLTKEIDKLRTSLNNYNIKEEMKHYTEISMEIFKHRLAKKYKKTNRKNYEKSDLKKFSNEFLKDYPVILSTTYSLVSSLSKNVMYDYLIIDESSQVDLVTAVLSLSCAKNVVIVGDLKQLSNVVTNENAIKSDEIWLKYHISNEYRFQNNNLLSSVMELYPNVTKTMLKEHYRCNPKIINFCNLKYYNNELIILSNTKPSQDTLQIYVTNEGNHAREHINRRQIDIIKEEIIPSLKIKSNETLGIISPYVDQSFLLKQEFKNYSSVQADTVDKFQGREEDIIIFSSVDNKIKSFTDQPNRLNVVVSRAINKFILVVNNSAITNAPGNIQDLIKYIKYQDGKIVNSKLHSCFDLLYKEYYRERQKIAKRTGIVSEDIFYEELLKMLNKNNINGYNIVTHVPLDEIIEDLDSLTEEEMKFKKNIHSHVDFLIFDRASSEYRLAIEVDGGYHNPFKEENAHQVHNDNLKNQILKKADLPLIRCKTDGIPDENEIIKYLR